MDIIEFKNVDFKYSEQDEFGVLRGISLNVKKGEFLCVLGHNGCGKSTLAKLINGLLLPNKGTVLVKGMDTSKQENIIPIRSCAGMVFQNPDNQMVATIVEEDVAFGCENLGIESALMHERVADALKNVDMSSYAQKAPHNLSGGQKQRVAIAGVLAMQPEVIILDEATAMLDPRGRSDILQTVKRLNKEKNITVVYITHYMEEAAEADRIVVLDKGKIMLEGTPQEVFSKKEELEKLTLELPPVAHIASRLCEEGVIKNKDILDIKELAQEICQFI